jgi:hypothetical protein
MREKGVYFNFGFLIAALASILLLFMPYARINDSNGTTFTIIGSNVGVGIMIFILTVTGFVFSFIKRKRVGIATVGIGFAAFGLYGFSRVAGLDAKLSRTVQAMQHLQEVNGVMGTAAIKVTYEITPVFYLFAVACLLAAGLAAVAFMLSPED